MTQPPYLGQAKPPSTDFGATTVSGAPATNAAPAAGRPADPSARTA
ncbi:MAG: hypothetical protein QOK11_2388, partial [Pseudonocardiales bacterium]|nr:hypothetical protein [Pseudonocardiales bacterium]